MKLQSIEILKAKKLEDKTAQEVKMRRNAYKLLIELKEKLEEFLVDNDSICIEVPENQLAFFIDLLKEDSLAAYTYEQIEPTLFVFKSEELPY